MIVVDGVERAFVVVEVEFAAAGTGGVLAAESTGEETLTLRLACRVGSVSAAATGLPVAGSEAFIIFIELGSGDPEGLNTDVGTGLLAAGTVGLARVVVVGLYFDIDAEVAVTMGAPAGAGFV
jgi:hypothetical protein